MNNFGLGNIQQRYIREVATELPKILGTHILVFFRGNYAKEGFEDKGFIPWEKRKYRVTPERKILVKTGTLRDSLELTDKSFSKIRVATDVYYAKYLNDDRPFVYNSETLEDELEQIITNKLMKLFDL